MLPIEVTELGMVTDVNPVRREHRPDGIMVTELPILKVLILLNPYPNGELAQLIAFQFTVVMLGHSKKTSLPNDATALPMVTEVMPLQ